MCVISISSHSDQSLLASMSARVLELEPSERRQRSGIFPSGAEQSSTSVERDFVTSTADFGRRHRLRRIAFLRLCRRSQPSRAPRRYRSGFRSIADGCSRRERRERDKKKVIVLSKPYLCARKRLARLSLDLRRETGVRLLWNAIESSRILSKNSGFASQSAVLALVHGNAHHAAQLTCLFQSASFHFRIEKRIRRPIAHGLSNRSRIRNVRVEKIARNDIFETLITSIIGENRR